MARGVIFIGADYRLLHPLTGHDEIEDVKTLFRFLSKDISRHFPSGVALDSTRLAVAGFSAGVTLVALLAYMLSHALAFSYLVMAWGVT